MTYGAGTCKFIFAGTMQGSEVFAHGFQGNVPTTTVQSDLSAICAAVAGLWSTNFLTTTIKGLFPSTTVWTTLTAYLYQGGKNAALTAQSQISAGNGTAGGGALPNQIALVATLLSGVPGRTNRGRSYLPGPTFTALGNGQLTVANAGTIAAAFASFLTAVKNAPTWGALPVIASPHTGSFQPLKSIRIDTKLDTQRRRSNKVAVAGASTINI